MQNDDTNTHNADEVIEEGHDATEEELEPLEPTTGAGENEGPSEGGMPEDADAARENMFPSNPVNPEGE